MKTTANVRVALSVAVAAGGCQIIGGIDDIEYEKGAPSACDGGVCPGGSGGSAGSAGSSGAAGADASAGGAGGTGGLDAGGGTSADGRAPFLDGGLFVPPCDPEERPIDEDGVFVSPDGSDASNGARQAPYATIAKAVETALIADRQYVYLAPGAYQEVLTLSDLGSGITIRGGWTLDETRWLRDCQEAARSETVVSPPASPAPPDNTPVITLAGDIGLSALQSLTVQTKIAATVRTDPGDSGESLIGIHVDETAVGSLNLFDVVVRANNGGDGVAGIDATAPTAADCSAQTTCADGTSGATGADGVTPSRGLFTPTGYLPGAGGEATRGAYGADGLPGGFNEVVTCYTSCTPNTTSGVCQTAATTAGGDQGECGCGGPSGHIGTPGGGGGASVGILVAASGFNLGVAGSHVEASDGGDGADGGAASVSGAGTDGTATAAVSCSDGCAAGYPTCGLRPAVDYPPGQAGGTGGPGGDSGNGGTGVGGPSYAIVTIGTPQVTVVQSDLVFGQGGLTPGSARAEAAETFSTTGLCGDALLAPGEECDDGNRVDGDACSNDCRLNCGGSGEIVDPETGTCYTNIGPYRTFRAARSLCQNLGPAWDILVPSEARALTFLQQRLDFEPQGYLGIESLDAAVTWTSVNEQSVLTPLPWVTPPIDSDPNTCVEIAADGQIQNVACTKANPVLCERRIAAFQTANCGNGELDRFEECDDGNTEPDDGCSPACAWECPGGLGTLSFQDGACFIRPTPLTGNFSDQRVECQALGEGWDLPIIETPEELSRVSAIVGAGNFWLGADNSDAAADGGPLTNWRWIDGTEVDTSQFPILESAPANYCAYVTTTPSVNYIACTNINVQAICEYKLP